jgi:hypothetical protein
MISALSAGTDTHDRYSCVCSCFNLWHKHLHVGGTAALHPPGRNDTSGKSVAAKEADRQTSRQVIVVVTVAYASQVS